jgi:hypothetical protein
VVERSIAAAALRFMPTLEVTPVEVHDRRQEAIGWMFSKTMAYERQISCNVDLQPWWALSAQSDDDMPIT